MLPWRRRNEGFEWREYVRTTILLKRNDRRRRIEEAKISALGAVKEASLEGAGRARNSLNSATRGLTSALVFAARLPSEFWALARPRLAHALFPVWSAAGSRASKAAFRFGVLLQPAFTVLARREIRLPLLLIGVIAAIGALQRQMLHGFDQEVVFAAVIAIVTLLLVAVPFYGLGGRLRAGARARDMLEAIGFTAQRVPGLQRWSALGLGLSAAALIALAGAGALWTASGGGSRSTSARPPSALTTAALPDPSPTGAMEGKAAALSGDSLRFGGGALVKLAGVEAPEREQTCVRAGSQQWRCGDAARAALERLVRGRRVVCRPSGAEAARTAECSVQGEDIAESLVRAGHVFAVHGQVTRYLDLEREARTAKAGLWAGEAERPQAFRDKKWDEARRLAPEGCPIKGQVSGRGRVYHLPWSPAYARIKVREAKGERWFCSEEEARAAGWKATSRS